MTDKIRQIKYWQATADDDLEAIDLLFQGGKYVQSLFFAHLALEKILKAHWIKNNPQNVPPQTPT
ncbi:MAG: HEPN domain-containing protein [Saprospiraceae bacterium]|jgi:HEPN domain-containing protein|nr:HEPN domain-containing protein [Saprospiraceae bacterium]